MTKLWLLLAVCLLAAGCAGSDGTTRFGGPYGGIGAGAGKR